jgi:hypothetical protein
VFDKQIHKYTKVFQRRDILGTARNVVKKNVYIQPGMVVHAGIPALGRLSEAGRAQI